MKRKILVAAAFFAAILCFQASAATLSLKNGNVALTLPDEYIAVTQDNTSSHKNEAQLLGFTDKTLKKHMRDNGILLLALTGNNTRQIQLRCVDGPQDGFAAKVGDLSLLDDDAITESAGQLAAQLAGVEADDCTVVANADGIKAIRIVSSTEETAVYQYVTVRNGEIYSLVGYDGLNSDGAYLAGVFETLTIKKLSPGFSIADGSQLVTTIIIIGLIAVALFIIIRLVISFVYDFRNRENDVSDYVKIKRRKF